MLSNALAAVLALSVPARAAPAGPDAVDRQAIHRALADAKVVDPDRILAHYSHTCDLVLDGTRYPVVDLRELVRNARVPRGYNRIIVFRPDWRVAQSIEYIDHRPLLCRGNELFVFGELQIAMPRGPSQGNVLVFSDQARELRLRSVDWLTLPTFREREHKP